VDGDPCPLLNEGVVVLAAVEGGALLESEPEEEDVDAEETLADESIELHLPVLIRLFNCSKDRVVPCPPSNSMRIAGVAFFCSVPFHSRRGLVSLVFLLLSFSSDPSAVVVTKGDERSELACGYWRRDDLGAVLGG